MWGSRAQKYRPYGSAMDWCTTTVNLSIFNFKKCKKKEGFVLQKIGRKRGYRVFGAQLVTQWVSSRWKYTVRTAVRYDGQWCSQRGKYPYSHNSRSQSSCSIPLVTCGWARAESRRYSQKEKKQIIFLLKNIYAVFNEKIKTVRRFLARIGSVALR